MTTWNDFAVAGPALADAVRARFEAHGLGLLATIRKDGSPRISGIEPMFAFGELWLGMMPGSRKVDDLRRDPRLALHNATIDKGVANGDAKLSGRAIEVTDPDAFERYHAEFGARHGEVPPGPFPLFRLDVTEVTMLRPAGDHLVIETWKPGSAVERIERR